MTIDEYLETFKEYAPIKEHFGTREGSFAEHQQTYMDEKDLAEYDFRKNRQGQKFLDDFVKI